MSAYPCVDDNHRYSGCIGVAACAALGTAKCWDGRRLLVQVETLGPAPREVKEVAYQHGTPCASCVHAVEEPDADRPRLADGRYHDERLFTCELGRWFGLASLYQLNNHRMPLGPEAKNGCDQYEPTAELRPELVRQREADVQRSRTRRRLLREARAQADCKPWSGTL